MRQKKVFTIFWAVAGIVVILVLLIGLFAKPSEDSYGWFSIQSAEPEGYKALYLMLPKLEIPVAHLKTNIKTSKSTAKLVWKLTSLRLYKDDDLNDLKEWVKQGNTLIVGGWAAHLEEFELKDDAKVFTRPFLSKSDKEDVINGESFLTKQVGKISYYSNPQPDEWNPQKASLRVILWAERTPLMLEEDLGNGKIIYLTQSEIFNNENIGKSDNAILAYNLVYHNSKSQTVYFDDGLRVSGRPGTWRLLFTAPFLWVSLQVILTVLLFIYADSRRFGAIKPLPLKARRSKDEYIYAMANLLLKKRNNPAILQIIKADFLRQLHNALGISGTLSEEQLIEQLCLRYQIPKDKLENLFHNITRKDTLSEKELLEIINEMEKILREVRDGKNKTIKQ